MRRPNALPALLFIVIVVVGWALAYVAASPGDYRSSTAIGLVFVAIGLIVAYSVKVANQWERAVVLRLGRFRALEGPGLFFIIPIVDTVAYWIDTRVTASAFRAEKTLTKDTVPVDVDAVLFWKVVDPKT